MFFEQNVMTRRVLTLINYGCFITCVIIHVKSESFNKEETDYAKYIISALTAVSAHIRMWASRRLLADSRKSA